MTSPPSQDGGQPASDPKQQTTQLKLQLRDQIIRANDLESQLIEAKMHWANLDMENDELTQKLQQKNQMLKVFSAQVTKLECELVGAKQQMGDALNQLHELEVMQLDQGGGGLPGLGRSSMSKSKSQKKRSQDRRSEESDEDQT